MSRTDPKELLELVLHPIRMRIVLAMVGQDRATAQQLARILSDVPQATLYRQLNRLAEAGLLTVVEERPVRGTVEKLYTLNQAANLGVAELATLTKEDHMRFFTAFVATLLSDFARYLERMETVNPVADGIGYSKVMLSLNDEELRNLSVAMNAAVLPYLQNRPGQGRRSRILASILIPDMTQGPQEETQNKNDGQ